MSEMDSTGLIAIIGAVTIGAVQIITAWRSNRRIDTWGQRNEIVAVELAAKTDRVAEVLSAKTDEVATDLAEKAEHVAAAATEKLDEIHTLTNSNLSEIKRQLEESKEQLKRQQEIIEALVAKDKGRSPAPEGGRSDEHVMREAERLLE